MGNICQSASSQAIRFLDVAPTSGLKSCVHDFLLHCLVFKEHCLPASSLSVLCASQLLYNISFSSFCQELFEIFFIALSRHTRLAFRPDAMLFCISATTMYILSETRNSVNTFLKYFLKLHLDLQKQTLLAIWPMLVHHRQSL